MPESIWSKPVESLYQDLAAPKFAPAGVVAAAVSARLGLALLIKVLDIVGRRKNFDGDPVRLRSMIQAAQRESAKLAAAADEDISGEPARKMSEIPMNAAHAIETGVALCIEARITVTGAIAADLEAATLLLDAAHGAILSCVESNLRGEP